MTEACQENEFFKNSMKLVFSFLKENYVFFFFINKFVKWNAGEFAEVCE